LDGELHPRPRAHGLGPPRRPGRGAPGAGHRAGRSPYPGPGRWFHDPGSAPVTWVPSTVIHLLLRAAGPLLRRGLPRLAMAAMATLVCGCCLEARSADRRRGPRAQADQRR
jgi:hypothetical protein